MKGVGGKQFFQFLQTSQAVTDGAEVGQRAAEPAFADVGHAAAGGFPGNRFLSLSFGANKQHEAARFGDLLEILSAAKQPANRLANIDDVNEVFATKDVGPHLWVPAAGAVAKMHTSFNEFLGKGSRHGEGSLSV